MILFSQVREDPFVELEAIKYLPCDTNNVLMIASGGCTLITLATSSKIKNIDVIDASQDQLYLVELKLAIFDLINNRNRYIAYIEGDMKKFDMYVYYKKCFLTPECRKYWDQRIELIYDGINKIGRFEKLFDELRESNYNFEKVFDRQYLIKIFGENAVINSLNQEFSDHFKNIINTYKKNYNKPDDNYFWSQIAYGYYQDDYPFYMDYNINPYIQINFIQSNLTNYMNYLTYTCNKYDLIQTSNITDWMDKLSVIKILVLIYKALNPHGIVVMRRLNSDINLKKIIKNTNLFNIYDDIIDKSHFYKEVIIAQKI